MKRTLQLFALFTAVLLPAAAQEPTHTNTIGMEFVLIQPGSMQVGVYEPYCPDPTKPVPAFMSASPGGGAARGGSGGRGAPQGAVGRGGAGASGPARGGAAAGRGATDPRVAWSEADYKRCAELAKQDSTPGFQVKIAKPYYLGKFEVTQGQWKKVMGNNPSTFQGKMVGDDADKHPVETVTWQQAQDFMKKLNQMEHTHLYRPPTEFEWEYAGRAGGPGQANWSDTAEQAVMSSPAGGRGGGPPPPPQTTSMVGTMKPNAWGLYDMLGNVWEWVADPYNEKLFPDPVPAKTGKEHVLKGGGFGAADRKNCSYSTHGAGPADEYDVGFRVLRDVK